MSKRKRKADNQAKTRGMGFAGLPHTVMASEAYRTLTPYGRSVLMEIIQKFNGYNNGQIAISQREIAHRLNFKNYGRIGRSVAELMEHGLIEVTVEGNWGNRKARQYRLTFISSTSGNFVVPATEEYRLFGHDNVSARKRDSAEHASAINKTSVDTYSATISPKRQKSVIDLDLAAEGVSSLIGKPYHPPERNGAAARRLTHG